MSVNHAGVEARDFFAGRVRNVLRTFEVAGILIGGIAQFTNRSPNFFLSFWTGSGSFVAIYYTRDRRWGNARNAGYIFYCHIQ